MGGADGIGGSAHARDSSHRRTAPPGWHRPSRQSERSGRDGRALRAPTGWHLTPSCCFGRWVAAAKRDNAFTREARPEGERVIRKRERTLVLSLLCAVRPRRPRPGPLGAGTPSALLGEYARMARRGRGTRRNGAPSRRALRGGFPPKGRSVDLTGPLRQRLTALSPPLKGEAGWVVQMASVGHAQARDPSLRSG